MVVIWGMLFLTCNIEKNPLIVFPNKITENFKKHAFVKVTFVSYYFFQSFSDHPVYLYIYIRVYVQI